MQGTAPQICSLSEEQTKLYQAKSAKSKQCICSSTTFSLSCHLSAIPLSLASCIKSKTMLPLKTSVRFMSPKCCAKATTLRYSARVSPPWPGWENWEVLQEGLPDFLRRRGRFTRTDSCALLLRPQNKRSFGGGGGFEY